MERHKENMIFPTSEELTQIPPEQIPAALAQLAAMQSTLAARLLAAPSPNGLPVAEADRLVDIKEAAQMLSVSPDWLYRRAGKLAFTVHLGRQLRFSVKGIEDYIRQRKGK